MHQAFLAANPDNCLAIYHFGYILGRLNDRRQEIEQYDRAAACGYNQDDQLYFNLGMAYTEMGMTEDALTAFSRATALDPGNADNHFGMGLAALSAGRPELARQALTKAVDLDPRHWDARLELARLALDTGRLEDARIQLEALQKGDPDDEDVQILWQIYKDRKITTFESNTK